MGRKIRVLVGKPGLDGHDRGAKVVAAALRDAGMEVIYTGLHQTPDQIVEAAVQEDVDVVALSILSGAHMTLFPAVQGLMRERGIGDKLLTGGGIIPPEDMDALKALGVGTLFGPGSSTQDIVAYVREWFAARFGAAALDPLPLPAPARSLEYASLPAPEPAPARARPRAGAAVAARAAAARRGEARHHAKAAKRPARKGTRATKPAKARAAGVRKATGGRAKTAARKAAKRPSGRRR
jgi:methylmalonyl-CoA mutase C-terminal domain/subunit